MPIGKDSAETGVSTIIPDIRTDLNANETVFLKRNAALIDILSRFADEETPLGQTCFLAAEGLKRQTAKVCACQFNSYDPAIGDPSATEADIPRCVGKLKDELAPLFDR